MNDSAQPSRATARADGRWGCLKSWPPHHRQLLPLTSDRFETSIGRWRLLTFGTRVSVCRHRFCLVVETVAPGNRSAVMPG
jgi:hypothetical protein